MIKLYLLNWRINLFCFVHIPIIFGNLPAAVLVYLFVNGQDSIVTFVLNLTINFDSAKALLTLPNSLSSLSLVSGELYIWYSIFRSGFFLFFYILCYGSIFFLSFCFIYIVSVPFIFLLLLFIFFENFKIFYSYFYLLRIFLFLFYFFCASFLSFLAI